MSSSRPAPNCPPLAIPGGGVDSSNVFCNETGHYDTYGEQPIKLLYFYNKNDTSLNASALIPWCEKESPRLIGRSKISQEVRSDADIMAANPHVQLGGHYHPTECTPRGRLKLAVLVVYRDRKEHLQILLNNLHPFLQRQQRDYTIFIVEQTGNATFNRGMLFNVGFAEASKLRDFDCFVFHDVDLLPENDRNSYSCPEVPTLLSSVMDKFKYKPLYNDYFGGVVSFSSSQFRDINGYPNVYWGWGGEDDDLGQRVRFKFGKQGRAALDIGHYTMIKHADDPGNPKNPERFKILGQARKRFTTDGLSSLSYLLLNYELRPLYTWILVDIGQPP
ncbi:beta-1,4-galactosyltransferase 3-like [Paramacrobiotus metropolitanus]|uniref:beta-1,4-galactosyltransferase 3-like n=1 Tax=Paramacrobiotus metropolitanus TaxID=2943436 RepID=UPI002445BFCA|nr:beta-1,4-galactosyltransferase 3-like [Paramacrobiotus metropolitanus]